MALTRAQYIEQIRRQIYGGQIPEGAEITIGLVNQWLNQAIGFAAQKNYTDTYKLDGIAVVNNSFYSTFSGLSVAADVAQTYKITLPQVPVGIGANEGVSTLIFKNSNNELSFPIIWLTMNQLAVSRGMRAIPNKVLGWQEGGLLFVKSTVSLTGYTATVTMVSGGDSTDLNTTLNVPPDYLPFVTDYITQQLMKERATPADINNDGIDNLAVKTT